MGNKGAAKREQIIEAANALIYQRGYNQTSFSDIAEASGLPRGNFYYYFRSKDEILSAVVEHRLASIRQLLEEWEAEYPEPRQRLKRFVQMLRNSANELLRYGCPIGSLNAELGKTQRPQQQEAMQMLDLFRTWLTVQMQALGHTEAEATHLVAMGQGATLLGSIYHDPTLLEAETARMDEWIDSL